MMIRISTSPIVLLFLCVFSSFCDARFEAAVVLPHGDFAYDPSFAKGAAERTAAQAIAKASRDAGKWINHVFSGATNYTMFLSTPHGIALSNDFGIYLGSTASGFADIGNDVPNATKYRVRLPPIPLASQLANSLLVNLRGENVSGIKTSADDSIAMPLEWGEIIPLSFLPSSDRSNYGQHCRYLIWSFPLRRLDEAERYGADMVQELLRNGALIGRWMDQQVAQTPMAVLISSDLSHTHRPDGPYGYSYTSQPFDDSIAHWASDPCRHASSLLELATKLQPTALSCGYTGLVLLHGMLCRDDAEMKDEWMSNVLDIHNVTYYGMMAATFRRKKAQESIAAAVEA